MISYGINLIKFPKKQDNLAKMKEIGKVIEVDEEYAFVELKNNDFCSKCWRCSEELANIDILDDDDNDDDSKFEEEIRQVLRVKSEKGIELYDRVEIEVSDNIYYVNLLIEFAMPLTDFLIGYIIGYYLSIYYKTGTEESDALIVGIIFFSISFWLSRIFSSDIMMNWGKYPKITKIIKNTYHASCTRCDNQ